MSIGSLEDLKWQHHFVTVMSWSGPSHVNNNLRHVVITYNLCIAWLSPGRTQVHTLSKPQQGLPMSKCAEQPRRRLESRSHQNAVSLESERVINHALAAF
jgi:hypothetical protein